MTQEPTNSHVPFSMLTFWKLFISEVKCNKGHLWIELYLSGISIWHFWLWFTFKGLKLLFACNLGPGQLDHFAFKTHFTWSQNYALSCSLRNPIRIQIHDFSIVPALVGLLSPNYLMPPLYLNGLSAATASNFKLLPSVLKAQIYIFLFIRPSYGLHSQSFTGSDLQMQPPPPPILPSLWYHIRFPHCFQPGSAGFLSDLHSKCSRDWWMSAVGSWHKTSMLWQVRK